MYIFLVNNNVKTKMYYSYSNELCSDIGQSVVYKYQIIRPNVVFCRQLRVFEYFKENIVHTRDEWGVIITNYLSTIAHFNL